MKIHFNSCKKKKKLHTRAPISTSFWNGANPQSAPGSEQFVSIIWGPPGGAQGSLSFAT